MGFLVHWEPGGQVPDTVLLARNTTLRSGHSHGGHGALRGGANYLGPESPYCTHCVSPLNLSTVCWKHSSVSASPSAGARHRR